LSPSQKIEIIKKWTPLAAVTIVIISSLIAFWGVVNFFIKFLEADSYFAVSHNEESSPSASVKERNEKISNLLQERAQKRQNAGVPPVLGNGEKDPFSLP